MEKKMENEMETREYIGLYRSYIGIMEKNMETTIVYRDHIGRMENKMETTIVYREYIGRMENNLETTILDPKRNAEVLIVSSILPEPFMVLDQSSASQYSHYETLSPESLHILSYENCFTAAV